MADDQTFQESWKSGREKGERTVERLGRLGQDLLWIRTAGLLSLRSSASAISISFLFGLPMSIIAIASAGVNVELSELRNELTDFAEFMEVIDSAGGPVGAIAILLSSLLGLVFLPVFLPLMALPFALVTGVMHVLSALLLEAATKLFSLLLRVLVFTFPALAIIAVIWLNFWLIKWHFYFMAISFTCLGDPLLYLVRRKVPVSSKFFEFVGFDFNSPWQMIFQPYVVVVKGTDGSRSQRTISVSAWWQEDSQTSE